MRVINPNRTDYHIHSINYSDGMLTIDEIVRLAHIAGMKEIAITDHSRAAVKKLGFGAGNPRSLIRRCANPYWNMNVILGVEADLLDENGKVCDYLKEGVEEKFVILSAHNHIYEGKPERITDGYIKALQTRKFNMVGHLNQRDFASSVSIKDVAQAAKECHVPLEFNCSSIQNCKSNERALEQILTYADELYVNSDAHTSAELMTLRKIGLQFLRESGLIQETLAQKVKREIVDRYYDWELKRFYR